MTSPKRSAGTGSYRRVRAWQRAMDMVEVVYSVSAQFPREERFGLTAQIRRAAVSVASNIAEGNERPSRLDQKRFLMMARGSIAEVETQLEIALRLGMANSDSASNAFELLDHAGRLITRLAQSLSRS
jgi:four helix bundle protein